MYTLITALVGALLLIPLLVLTLDKLLTPKRTAAAGVGPVTESPADDAGTTPQAAPPTEPAPDEAATESAPDEGSGGESGIVFSLCFGLDPEQEEGPLPRQEAAPPTSARRGDIAPAGR